MNQPSRSRRAATKGKVSNRADLRHVVVHDYHDHSMDMPTSMHEDYEIDHKKRGGPRGGVNVPFPTKLHIMLSRVEDEGQTDIVGWQPHGRCFIIHKPREFVDEIMPEYFRQSKLTSFQRQLNLYGFRRLTTGADRGGYYHEMFLKHKLFLCRTMTRTRIKGTGIKGKASPETEPNFYEMPEIRPDCDLVNQRIESEVITAMEREDESMPLSPRGKKAVVNASTQKPSRRSKRSTASKPVKYADDDESLANEPDVLMPPALVTPEAQYSKTPVSLKNPSGSSRRSIYPGAKTQRNLMDLAPPLMTTGMPRTMSNHSLMSDVEYHSDDRIAFEGQHFHYLDSFSMNEVAKPPTLSEPLRPVGMPPSRYSSVISLPQLTASISEDLSYDVCNSEVISSASSAHTEYSGPTETISFTPNTIFSREGERGSWSIDIDREFLLMES